MKILNSCVLVMCFSATASGIPAEAIRTTNVNDICSTRTGAIRNVSESLKGKIYSRDGIPGNHRGKCDGDGGCEVDHRVSLELGGSNDQSNLMIQPYFGPCNAHHKDHLENALHKLVCAGAIGPGAAQELIYNNWRNGYKQLVDPQGCGE